MVANRLHEHIYNHHLSNDLQSAYKRFHSTETSLLKIQNDIVDNMDNGKVTALILLDISVAFDTFDHLIFLQRLYIYFGISGPALRWFISYFSDRYQSINISGILSCPHHLSFGVPQGSGLGPVLFNLYTTSLSQIITNHNLSHHLYADDTQVYILSLSQSNAQESVSTLSDCLTDILFWMESSKLKLNPDKTDLIIIGTKRQRNRVINHFPIKLLGSDTFPSDTVRNLGVVFDKSCFSHIRDLRQIRRHISISTAKTISMALISSRLDYCNSLLNNIAKRDKKVRNCLAHVVLRAPRFSPSLPLLKQLHWLPVSYRIDFKLSTLTYRALSTPQQPPYLASLLHLANIPRQLRSSISQQLILPKTKLNLDKRAFSVAAPRVWNELPITFKTSETIAIFRKKLKTYLFQIPP